MSDRSPEQEKRPEQPHPGGAEDMHKVNEEVQEEAGKERAADRGYD